VPSGPDLQAVSLASDNQRLRSEVSELEAKLDALQTAPTTQQSNESVSEVRQLEQQLASAKQKLDQISASLAAAEQDKAKLAAANGQDTATITQQKAEIEKLRDGQAQVVANLVD